MNRRVVITGLGAVTPLGNDVKAFWNGIRNGVCAVAPIRAYDTTGRRVTLAAEVTLDPADYMPAAEAKRMDRFALFAVIAAEEALKDSGVTAENTPPERCGVLIASGVGGISTIEREQMRGTARGFDRISAFFIPMTISNMAAGQIAINAGFRGYASCVVTACAGGANAIGDAMRMIRHGYLDAVLCGGAEAAITPLTVGGFTAMRAMTETADPNRASIPFDLERSGFVLGEGAGVLMLEEYGRAVRRGARIYAELRGYGATCDAFHITAPEPACAGGAEAMRLALADAGLSPADIGYINAHGTSTPLNDKGEARAIEAVFGARAKRIPVSSTKSMTGHLLGAAGAVEAIVCALGVQEGFVPATVNFKTPDPECDLDIVPNVGQNRDIRHAMSNSLGFGGHNAALLLSRCEL